MQQLEHKTYEEARFKAPRELVAGMGTEDDDVVDAAAAQQQQQQEEVLPPSAREMLWRVNPEEFNRRFRNKVMADLVADKLGADAGTVLAAMLSHGRRFETTVQGDLSIAMGEGEVASALKAGQDAGRLPQLSPGKDAGALLNALAYDSLGAVDGGTGPQGATFIVNMRAVLDRCRLLQLHSVLRDKFGIHGLRVFQTLLMRGQLEQKQVADTVMQPHKETRELLYRMLRAGYVQMQDIPRTADRAPTRCFYTWHVDIDAVFGRLAADLYHAAVNLHTRRSHEMRKHSELVELVESARAAGQLNFNMTDSQRRALERLNKVSTALDTSLLRLDGMIALFNEY
ncbi:hypothetical protein OEZ85_003046 [Tetradesmus obliquus]|uniref:DNA-directed RNA polymerase III subunit RPC3 n=1 Tax=Tetradesmus obliquus TaxID=3088 RepID=A0ABY8TZE0_TETOB|nr:hypothetical protein OEZ85_003046 [Tetradesmus obliquus]